MSEPLSPSERSMQARIAAHKMHAAGLGNTEPARQAFLDGFALKVDPQGLLPPAERERRAEHLRKAHMTAMALASVKARRAKQPPRASR